VYVLTTIGGWMLVMKSSTVEVLGEDYVTVAKARGLRERRIRSAYVGRNAVLPLVPQLAITLGFVVGGSILVEQVFQYQGIGYLLLQSVQRRDYPVLQGILLVVTIAVVAANLVSDLCYQRLDPRVRVGGGEG
jgi:peptide/nickel transport system permease protein